MGLKFNKTLSQTLWTGLRGQISAYSKKNTNLLPCSAASPRQSLGWLGCWSGCKPIFRYFNPRAKLKHLAPLMAYCLHFQETHNSQHLPTKKRTQKSDSVASPEYQDRDHNPFRVKIETWSIFTNLTRALAVDYCKLDSYCTYLSRVKYSRLSVRDWKSGPHRSHHLTVYCTYYCSWVVNLGLAV